MFAMFDRRLIQNFDWILLLLLILIASISLLNLYSATYPIKDAGGSHIFLKQIYWFLIGFAVLLVVITFDYHVLDRFAYPIYIFTLILLVLVLMVGRAYSGSQRWLSLGGIVFQPSEFTKIVLVILLAKYFSDHEAYIEYRLRDLWRPFIIIILPCLFIVKEPDLGTSLVLVIISFTIIFFVRIRWRSFLILIIASFSATPFVWYTLKEYQQKRILSFLRPEMDPLGAGYHIIQSKIAVGSGLFWGKGFLNGTQTRLHFLPEQHTDFAFSVLAEEWGFAGSLILLMLYLFLILAIGIVAIIFWQLVINISMAVGLLPVVGIPLVLFSYGGSSVISTMFGMGLLMNVSMRRFMFQ
jgi:rod shape determining protein RodA